MSSRKGHSVEERKRRFDTVLTVLSGNPIPLNVPGLVAVLREAGHEIDPETPKKWGERGIPEKWARLIALLPRAQAAGLTAGWMREGTPPAPTVKRAAGEGTTTREQHNGARVRDDSSSESFETLSPDQIADEVGDVIEPLVQQLATKGGAVVARWLLTVAGEANDQGVENVKPLIDLAREFLYRAERAR